MAREIGFDSFVEARLEVAILEYLKTHPKAGLQQISRHIKSSPKTVSKLLKRYIRDELVRKNDRGKARTGSITYSLN